MLAAKNTVWFFADSIQWRMVGKRGRQVMNMLPFVMEITKKSLYTPPNTFVSVRRLRSSNKGRRHYMVKVRRMDS